MSNSIFYIKINNGNIREIKKEYLIYCDIFSLFNEDNNIFLNNNEKNPFLLLNINNFFLDIIVSLFENKDNKSMQIQILKKIKKDEIFELIDICNYLISDLLLDFIINYLSKLLLVNNNQSICEYFNINFYADNIEHLNYFEQNIITN